MPLAYGSRLPPLGGFGLKKRWNLSLPAGFLLAVGSLFSYFYLFSRFPITRDFPWANLPLSAAALYLLGLGLWRAYRHPAQYRGRIFGPILALPSLFVTGLLIFYIFHLSYQLPAAAGTPQVGERMPDISLPEQTGEAFQLSQLIPAVGVEDADFPAEATEGRWVLLVFYRGYW